MRYKKAFYFTLDAFLAVAILAVGFILIISSFSSKPSKVQTRHISDDLLNVLATVKWSELDTSYSPSSLYSNIKNPDLTVLEVIGESYATSSPPNEINVAKSIIEEILTKKGLIPNQFGYMFVLHPDTTSPLVLILCSDPSKTTLTNCEEVSKPASFLTSSKKFVFGTYLDGNTIQVWGPYIIEARVWRK